jgi:hypothetical protein
MQGLGLTFKLAGLKAVALVIDHPGSECTCAGPEGAGAQTGSLIMEAKPACTLIVDGL